MSKKLSKITHKNAAIDPKRTNDQLSEFKTETFDTVDLKLNTSLPTPNIIAGYEDIVPGAADRTITLVEQQSEHRQK